MIFARTSLAATARPSRSNSCPITPPSNPSSTNSSPSPARSAAPCDRAVLSPAALDLVHGLMEKPGKLETYLPARAPPTRPLLIEWLAPPPAEPVAAGKHPPERCGVLVTPESDNLLALRTLSSLREAPGAPGHPQRAAAHRAVRCRRDAAHHGLPGAGHGRCRGEAAHGAAGAPAAGHRPPHRPAGRRGWPAGGGAGGGPRGARAGVDGSGDRQPRGFVPERIQILAAPALAAAVLDGTLSIPTCRDGASRKARSSRRSGRTSWPACTPSRSSGQVSSRWRPRIELDRLNAARRTRGRPALLAHSVADAVRARPQ